MAEQQGTTRRDFLKTSAALAGTAAAVGSVAALPGGAYAAAADETLKIVLIGCGGRGTGACSQALSTAGPTKLIAVADAFKDKAEGALQTLKRLHPDKVDVAEDHIFAGFDAYKQAIDCGPDVVLLTTPPGFRPIHFEYAVKQSKNVFMEKPVSTDPAGIRRVLAAAQEAKKKNLKVSVGLQRHHQQAYIETIKRIWDGALGDLILCRAYWDDAGVWVRRRADLKKADPNLTEMAYQMRNWYYFNWLCGDHINEQHIHNLDVINWVKRGHPETAQGVGGRQVRTGIDNGEIYDHHMVEFTYPDGTKLLSQCRHQPNCYTSVSEHAHGTKGYSDISSFQIRPADGSAGWKYEGPRPDPYQVEHDDLFAAIRNNTEHNEAEYGAHSTMTSILGRMANYSGKPIKWDDAIEAEVSIMPEKFAWDAPPPSLPDADGRYSIPLPGHPYADDASRDQVWKRVNAEIQSWLKHPARSSRPKTT